MFKQEELTSLQKEICHKLEYVVSVEIDRCKVLAMEKYPRLKIGDSEPVFRNGDVIKVSALFQPRPCGGEKYIDSLSFSLQENWALVETSCGASPKRSMLALENITQSVFEDIFWDYISDVDNRSNDLLGNPTNAPS